MLSYSHPMGVPPSVSILPYLNRHFCQVLHSLKNRSVLVPPLSALCVCYSAAYTPLPLPPVPLIFPKPRTFPAKPLFLSLKLPDFRDVCDFLIGDHSDMFNQKAELHKQVDYRTWGSCKDGWCAEGGRKGEGRGLQWSSLEKEDGLELVRLSGSTGSAEGSGFTPKAALASALPSPGCTILRKALRLLRSQVFCL